MQVLIIVLIVIGVLGSFVASRVEEKAPRQYREKLSYVTDMSALCFVVGFGLAVLTAFL